MASLNKVLLMGNLTRAPELRATTKGTAVCQFGLAVNRQFTGEDGNKRDDVVFVDIEAWGKQANLCAKYLAQGDPAFIEGRLRLDQWEDKQSGQKRSRLKVVLENVQFLGKFGQGQGNTNAEENRGLESQGTAASVASEGVAVAGEDVAF
jgi:single-strand DNA-binding protein